jgi:hypothetical protein
MKLVVEKLNWIDMSECCVTNADKLVRVTVEGYDTMTYLKRLEWILNAMKLSLFDSVQFTLPLYLYKWMNEGMAPYVSVSMDLDVSNF